MGCAWNYRLCTGLVAVWCLAQHVSQVAGQFPPKPEGMNVVTSKFDSGIKISYKEVSCDSD